MAEHLKHLVCAAKLPPAPAGAVKRQDCCKELLQAVRKMAEEEAGTPVDLYVYDLTQGLAALLSPALLGRQVAGVWHTALVVYGREYFYGSGGITSCAPGGTELGAPQQVTRLGSTFVPRAVFADYLRGLADTTYNGAAYRLLEHNCNHFSDEAAQFLCGARLPHHIVAQPERDLPPPLRAALAALLQRALPAAPAPGPGAAREDSPDFLTLNTQIEEARQQSHELEQRRTTLAEKLARTERRRQRRQHRDRRARGDAPDGSSDTPDGSPDTPDDEMAECVQRQEGQEAAGPSSRPGGAPEEPEQPERPPRDPPILYQDIDAGAEFAALARALEEAGLARGEEERQSLDELRQYLVLGEGSWVLGDEFLAFVGGVLGGAEGADKAAGEAGGAARRALLRCLAAAALRDDVSLLLHQDRRHHALLAYAHGVDALPEQEQLALALFMCNLFAHAASAEWLLYISEWEARGRRLANIRVTTKVCVHCALSELPALRDAGTALLHNVATKEVKTVVFDEVCAELALAALQLLRAAPAPAEEHVWRACCALARLAHHSPEVPQLVAVVGPDPAAYRGTSPRVDEQIDLILQKVK